MKPAAILLLTILCTFSLEGIASPYFEAGTSAGTLKNGDSFFNQAGASSSGLGFIGSFNFYVPVTSLKRFFHLELGLQNRLTSVSTNGGSGLMLASTNLSTRLEISRLYVGAGYSPFAYGSTSGLMGLHTIPNASAYFLEGGLIWRVIPEFQITLSGAMEFANTSGGGSKLSTTEYGLRFRFPLKPKEMAGGGNVDFDGFRYPFGVMK